MQTEIEKLQQQQQSLQQEASKSYKRIHKNPHNAQANLRAYESLTKEERQVQGKINALSGGKL